MARARSAASRGRLARCCRAKSTARMCPISRRVPRRSLKVGPERHTSSPRAAAATTLSTVRVGWSEPERIDDRCVTTIDFSGPRPSGFRSGRARQPAPSHSISRQPVGSPPVNPAEGMQRVPPEEGRDRRSTTAYSNSARRRVFEDRAARVLAPRWVETFRRTTANAEPRPNRAGTLARPGSPRSRSPSLRDESRHSPNTSRRSACDGATGRRSRSYCRCDGCDRG